MDIDRFLQVGFCLGRPWDFPPGLRLITPSAGWRSTARCCCKWWPGSRSSSSSSSSDSAYSGASHSSSSCSIIDTSRSDTPPRGPIAGELTDSPPSRSSSSFLLPSSRRQAFSTLHSAVEVVRDYPDCPEDLRVALDRMISFVRWLKPSGTAEEEEENSAQ